MGSHESLYTARLMLRRPEAGDAEAIFERYSADPVVTRYLSWPMHRTLEDTHLFLKWSDAEWETWPSGPLLAFSRDDGRLLGGTGLSFRSATEAVTGYVFARAAWRQGYATESTRAMVELARKLGVKRLKAVCHVEHRPSAHVLEKSGFVLEAIRRKDTEFPNLAPGGKCDVLVYVRTLADG
jgi:[ribosomal protein S5]-alanine N-acetyltransferase